MSKITPEQQKIIDEAVEEFRAVGLCTDPADFEATKGAVINLYDIIDLEPPKFITCESPLAANKILQKEYGMKGFTSTWFAGQWDAWLWGWGETGRRLGVKLPDDLDRALDAHLTITRNCGWLYLYEEVAILCDRPDRIRLDDEWRLHSEDGAAIHFRDGLSAYFWRGTRIPGEWIEKKGEMNPKIALTWDNIEQRRCAAEIIGWHNVLSQLEAVTIDEDPDPEIGTLVEVNLPDVGRERFLRVMCGTGREFALPVPPDTKTALAGNAWTYGLEPDMLKPEVRT